MSNQLASEKVIVSAPMSFHGSAARIWKLTGTSNPYIKWLIIVPLTLLLISFVWFAVVLWYLVFGIILIPYRLIRRGSRKNKRDKLRHREIIDVIAKNKQ